MFLNLELIQIYYRKSVMQVIKFKNVYTIASTLMLSVLLASCSNSGGSNDDSGESGDTVAPVIMLNGSTSININQGNVFSDAGATATDDVDGDISANITVGGDVVDTTTVGNYTITYNVSDAAGNAASQSTRTVIVNAVSASGITSFIAYTVGDGLNNSKTIYTVRGNGADHRKLHPNIPSGGEITEYSWSPATARVAYLGDVDNDTISELYTAQLDQNTRVKINGNLVSGGDVVEYKWSPDGSKVAYRANEDDFGKVELYVADADGQNRVKVSTTLIGGGNVENFSWSPAGTHLLYRADNMVNEQFNWHVATANGSISNQVNVNLLAGEAVVSPRWSPSGGYIDYIHDLVGNGDVDLYIYKLSDFSNTKMATFTFTNTQDYEWSESDTHFAVGQQFGGMSVFSFDGVAVVNVPDTQAFEFIPGSENLVVTKTIVISQFNHDQSVGVFASDGSVVAPEVLYASNKIGAPRDINFSLDATKVVIDFNASSGSDEVYVYNMGSNSAIDLRAVASNFIPNSTGLFDDVKWSENSTRILVDGRGLLISPDGSGQVDLDTSTSSSPLTVLQEQWSENNVFLVRPNSSGPQSQDILRVDEIGQNLLSIANSETTHAFYCIGGPCNGVEAFKVSSDSSFLAYKRVGLPSSAAGDDLHVVNANGTGDIKISIDLDPNLGLRITDYSIQPIN